MKRSIFGSLLVMALAVGVFAFGGTYAAFTDSQTASGSVNGAPVGSINLRLSEAGPLCGLTGPTDDEVTFDGLEGLLPGGFRTCSVQLVNIGSEPFDVDVIGADTSGSTLDVCDGLGDDYTVSLAKGPDTGGDDPDADRARVTAGTFQEAAITVMLNPGVSNDCQATVADIKVLFTASSIP
jgi:predicted ribosomally synthesized peptide with SipW-like signal peptide